MATKTLSEIINKGFARLTKIAETAKKVREGKPISVKSGVSALQKIQRDAEKTREAYIKDVMENRTKVLGEVNMPAIKAGRTLADRGITEAHEIVNKGWKRKALLTFELLVCEIKEQVAEIDVVDVINAAEDFDDFGEWVNEYTLETLASMKEIDAAKIKAMWERAMPEKNVKVLSRASTPYGAIDIFRMDAVRSLNECKSAEEVTPIINKFIGEVNTRFKNWGVDFKVDEVK